MSLKYKDIISRISLEEKALLVSGKNTWETVDFEKYGISSIFLSDGPHGLRKQAGKGDQMGIHGSLPSTCFPTAATVANSWDEALGEEIGAAVGEEAVSLDVNMVLGPGLNIKRSPLCGRNFEYFSEDPYLAGKMAAAYIRGIQSNGIAACPKHFAVNSQETRRMAMDSVVDERTFREIYTANFEIAVKEGHAKAIMTSYNQVNGTYANENIHLLQDILKDEWGFEGMVVSDWGGSNDHALGVKNGSHLEMPGTGKSGQRDILRAVKKGSLSEAALDLRIDEMLKVIFDIKPATLAGKGREFDVEAHHALARKAASESIVLLKNEGGILPLQESTDLVVIGDFAKTPRYQGAGSSLVKPTKEPESVLNCIMSSSLNLVGYEQGYARNSAPKQELMDQAVELAKKAASMGQTILICAGLDEISECEGMDRSHMKLPQAQNDLIEAVTAVSDKVIVILSAGSAVEMPWFDKVEGLLHGYLGGQAGASAMMDILTGKICPGGKLNETYAYQAKDYPAANYWPSPEKSSEHREGIYTGYRYFDTAEIPVRFPFGYGLSYTSFAYSDLTVQNDGVSFTLTNTGAFTGAEVAQLYVSRKSDTVFRPKKELKGFVRVELAPGESGKAKIPFDDKTFRFFDVRTNTWEIEGGEYEILISADSSDEGIRLRDKRNLPGTVKEGPYRKEEFPSYFSADIKNVPDAEFGALYGKKIPESRWTEEIGMNDAVCRLKYGKGILGRAFCGILEMMLKSSIKKGKPDLNVLFNYNMPIRGFAKMTGGIVTMDMAEALVEMANGHRIKGTWHLLKAAVVRKA